MGIMGWLKMTSPLSRKREDLHESLSHSSSLRKCSPHSTPSKASSKETFECSTEEANRSLFAEVKRVAVEEIERHYHGEAEALEQQAKVAADDVLRSLSEERDLAADQVGRLVSS